MITPPVRATSRAGAEAGVLVAEGMWTRYLPQFDVLHQVVQRGDLGEIRLATADVGWQVPFDPDSRLHRPDLGGGALLDMGVYAVWFAQFAIGAPTTIAALGTVGRTGVDEQVSVALAAGERRHAAVTVSMVVAK